MGEKNRESDLEIHFKDTFRAFSKDNDGKYTRVQGIIISVQLVSAAIVSFFHISLDHTALSTHLVLMLLYLIVLFFNCF